MVSIAAVALATFLNLGAVEKKKRETEAAV